MRDLVRSSWVGLVGLVGLAAVADAADWPQYQGPARTAISAETGLARSWPASGPPQRWATEIGPGFGGAAVHGGEVFLLDREGERADVLRCFDLETGAERWRFAYEAPGRLHYGGPRCTPTVTDTHVYTIGAFGQVYCVDRATHEPVWNLDMAERFAGEMPDFGWAQSPLLHGDLVIVAPLGPEAGLAGLDAATGETRWTSAFLGTSHSNPVIMDLAGRTQVVQMSRDGETGMITGLDPDTGGRLWQSNAYLVKRSIPSPTRIGGDRLFITGGYQKGSLMLEVTATGDGFDVAEIFRVGRGAQIHLPILHDDHLYLIVNENWTDKRRQIEGGLMCMDLAGREKWRTGDAPYLGRGGMLLADGMLVVQDGLGGTLRLVDPRPDGFRVLATCDVFGPPDGKDHRMWAPLALSDGRLLMRSQDELKCLDLRSALE